MLRACAEEQGQDTAVRGDVINNNQVITPTPGTATSPPFLEGGHKDRLGGENFNWTTHLPSLFGPSDLLLHLLGLHDPNLQTYRDKTGPEKGIQRIP